MISDLGLQLRCPCLRYLAHDVAGLGRWEAVTLRGRDSETPPSRPQYTHEAGGPPDHSCGDCCRFAPKGRVRLPTFPKPYLRFHRRGACRDESIWQLRPSVRPVGLGPGGAGLARPARAALAVISTRGIARAIAGYDARPVAGGGQHLSWLIKNVRPQIAKQALAEPSRFAACAVPPPILAAVNGAAGRVAAAPSAKKKRARSDTTIDCLLWLCYPERYSPSDARMP